MRRTGQRRESDSDLRTEPISVLKWLLISEVKAVLDASAHPSNGAQSIFILTLFLSKALCSWCWMHRTVLNCIKWTALKTCMIWTRIPWDVNYKPNWVGKSVLGEGASAKSGCEAFSLEATSGWRRHQTGRGVRNVLDTPSKGSPRTTNAGWCDLKELWSSGFVIGQTHQNHWVLLIFSGCFLVFQPPAVTQLAGWGPKQLQ